MTLYTPETYHSVLEYQVRKLWDYDTICSRIQSHLPGKNGNVQEGYTQTDLDNPFVVLVSSVSKQIVKQPANCWVVNLSAQPQAVGITCIASWQLQPLTLYRSGDNKFYQTVITIVKLTFVVKTSDKLPVQHLIKTNLSVFKDDIKSHPSFKNNSILIVHRSIDIQLL